jgi:hypothetical protein
MGSPAALWYLFAQVLGSFATRPGFEVNRLRVR